MCINVCAFAHILDDLDDLTLWAVLYCLESGPLILYDLMSKIETYSL